MIASICQNNYNLRGDFDTAAAVLLPVDPYRKNMTSQEPESFEVSSMSGKKGKSIGTDLHYHTVEEYTKISDPQKKELIE